MIKFLNAIVTDTTVRGSRWPQESASWTYFVLLVETFVVNILNLLVYANLLKVSVLLLTVTFDDCVEEVFGPKRDVRLPGEDSRVFKCSLALVK